MLAYIIRRLIQSIFVVFIVTFLAFVVIKLIPGDPVKMMLGLDAPPDQVAKIRSELWLDRPMIVQYGHWLGNALRGNLGVSIRYGQNVSDIMAQKVPVTLYLGALAFVISAVIGISAGIICAIRRGGIFDQFISVLSNLGLAVPSFLLGILGIYFVGYKLGWLPTYGFTSPFDNFAQSLKQSIMPVICLTAGLVASLARQQRSSMLEVISQDYVRTAWAKGLKERSVILRHALKNSLIPIVTLLGMQVRFLIGGTVVVETVFSIAGLGRLLVESVLNKDFVVVQAGVLVMASIVVITNLVVDLSYGYIDPRIRYG